MLDGVPVFKGSLYIEEADLNVCVYHEQYWRYLLEENFVWAIVCTYLPTTCASLNSSCGFF